MPKATGQKLKLLYLRDYLLKYSDENHPLSISDMVKHLASKGISAERKALYDDLAALEAYGLDIGQRRVGRSTGYFVLSRDFELSEVKLLVDAVQSSRFISEKKSRDLIGRIEGLASHYEGRELHRHVVVQNRGKSSNEAIFINVDTISEAINRGVMVEFRYFDYDRAKNIVFRHGGAVYRVSAEFMVWDDENYYLVATPEGDTAPKHYRIDKMKSVTLSSVPASPLGVDQALYAGALFGMFSGELTKVRIRFKNSLSGVAVDRFGHDLAFVPYDGDSFTLTAQVAVSGQFLAWIAALGGGAEIMSPPEVRQKMKDFLTESLKPYKNDK